MNSIERLQHLSGIKIVEGASYSPSKKYAGCDKAELNKAKKELTAIVADTANSSFKSKNAQEELKAVNAALAALTDAEKPTEKIKEAYKLTWKIGDSQGANVFEDDDLKQAITDFQNMSWAIKLDGDDVLRIVEREGVIELKDDTKYLALERIEVPNAPIAASPSLESVEETPIVEKKDEDDKPAFLKGKDEDDKKDSDKDEDKDSDKKDDDKPAFLKGKDKDDDKDSDDKKDDDNDKDDKKDSDKKDDDCKCDESVEEIAEKILNPVIVETPIEEAKDETLWVLKVKEPDSEKFGVQFSGTKSECSDEWKDTKHTWPKGSKHTIERHVDESVEMTDIEAIAAAIIAEKNDQLKAFDSQAVDYQNSPEENTGIKKEEGQKIRVPADVKKHTKQRISELKSAIERYDDKGYNDKSIKQQAVDCLEQILDNLAAGNVESVKQAQIYFGTLMSPLTDFFPPSLINFLAHALNPNIKESKDNPRYDTKNGLDKRIAEIEAKLADKDVEESYKKILRKRLADYKSGSVKESVSDTVPGTITAINDLYGDEMSVSISYEGAHRDVSALIPYTDLVPGKSLIVTTQFSTEDWEEDRAGATVSISPEQVDWLIQSSKE